jgi:hypothetical protein
MQQENRERQWSADPKIQEVYSRNNSKWQLHKEKGAGHSIQQEIEEEHKSKDDYPQSPLS